MRLLHDFPKAINVVLVTFAVLLGCRTSRVSQKEKMGEKPYYEYNGQPTNKIESINPNTITLLIKIFPKSAVKKYGAKASDGAVLIESRAYARTKFESLFSSFSKEYAKIIASTDTSDIQYILNGKTLTGNFEGYLSRIDRQSLKKIGIINQNELSSKFQITNKLVGVVVRAKIPSSKSTDRK